MEKFLKKDDAEKRIKKLIASKREFKVVFLAKSHNGVILPKPEKRELAVKYSQALVDAIKDPDSQASQTAKTNGMMAVPAIVDGEACWRRVNLNKTISITE